MMLNIGYFKFQRSFTLGISDIQQKGERAIKIGMAIHFKGGKMSTMYTFFNYFFHFTY